jgi:multiple sugar transport system substrate-binding protein
VQAAFANGELAMAAMTTPTWVPALEGGVVAGKYAFAPHPLVPPGAEELPEGGEPAGSIVSGDMLAIADYSDCKASAIEYIEYVTNTEQQTNYYTIFGSIPANREAGEALAAENETVQAFVDATGDSVPTSFTGAWGNVQLGLTNVVTQSLEDLQKGTYDEERIRALLTEANATVQRDLDRQSDAG